MLKGLIKEISGLVLPPPSNCPLCRGRRVEKNKDLCFVCRKELGHWNKAYYQCGICGRFLIKEGPCRNCLVTTPPFTKAKAVGPYRGILKESLHNLKFHGDRRLANPLGKMLGKAARAGFETKNIDVVIPVPMYIENLKIRGFNQAELIASAVGIEIRKPVIKDVLIKNKDTPPQIQLSRGQRMKNLVGSFAVKNRGHIYGKTLLLVDDIYTTGSTVRECTLELLKSGAAGVYVGTVATGLIPLPTE